MKFEDLENITKEMAFNISNFDSFRTYRPELNEFMTWVRRAMPEEFFKSSYLQKEVPPEVLDRFNALYMPYQQTLRENATAVPSRVIGNVIHLGREKT